jgi:hypothetical protein
MPDFLWALLIIAGYFIVMKWILPGLGVPT